MNIYATIEDLPEAQQSDPNAPALLQHASALVTSALMGAVFPVDSYGMPTGDDLEACRLATVSQVSTWLSTGVNPITGLVAVPREMASKGSNGSTVTYVQNGALTAWYQALASGSTLTDTAAAFLEAQGLLETVIVGTHGRGRMYHPVPSPDILIDGGEG